MLDIIIFTRYNCLDTWQKGVKTMSLRELRLKCQKTQQEIAEEIGEKRSTYSMWETKKARPPFKKIKALARALFVSEIEIIDCFR